MEKESVLKFCAVKNSVRDGVFAAAKTAIVSNICAVGASAIKAGALDRDIVRNSITDQKVQLGVAVASTIVGVTTAAYRKTVYDKVIPIVLDECDKVIHGLDEE